MLNTFYYRVINYQQRINGLINIRSSLYCMQFPFEPSDYLRYAHLFGHLCRMNERVDHLILLEVIS